MHKKKKPPLSTRWVVVLLLTNPNLTDRYPRYHHTRCSYSDTVYTGSATYAHTKEITGIETDMVHVTLPFNNVIATPNGIRVKYHDVNIAQANHAALLKLQFLFVKARCLHLFYTLASGSLLSLRKPFNAGCTAYLNDKKFYILFQGKTFLRGVRSASNTFLWKLNEYHNHYQEYE